jgi:CDP-glucose 4,6-dehydratase
MLTQLKDYQGKKILVTGHTGFKGAWLSRILVLAGADVYGVALEPEPGSLFTKIKNIGFEESSYIDIRNAAAVNEYFTKRSFDGVFHLAAQPLVIKSYVEPVETFETNVMGTANLLQSIMVNKSSPWTVVVTTDKVYKNVEKFAGYTEEEPLGGKDPYSASKAATEMVVSAWQNLGSRQNPTFKVVAVRAGNVIGGGDTAENRLIPDLIRGFLANTKTIIRFPNSIRPWQHVLDPLNGYLTIGCTLMADKKISPAYNFGPGDESKLTVQQMAEYSCEQWPGSQGIDVREDRNALPESGLLWLSSNLATQELGWLNRFEAKEAIRWTIEWEKESMNSTPLQALDNQINAFFGEEK